MFYISIHALLAESDIKNIKKPVQGFNFYPRSPCGERLIALFDFPIVPVISIHALLAESDECTYLFLSALPNFYPRSPCGERLDVNNPVFAVTSISIHALLAESDPFKIGKDFMDRISIHALLAESDVRLLLQLMMVPLFLSTLSLRRATACLPACVVGASISIHALLAESDYALVILF